MAWISSDYELQLAKIGTRVAVNPKTKFKCWMCDGGILQLTRLVVGDTLAPACFKCESCGDEVGIYPDGAGGVRPALMQEKETKLSGKKEPLPKNDPGAGMNGSWS